MCKYYGIVYKGLTVNTRGVSKDTEERPYRLLQRHQQYTWKTAGPLEHNAIWEFWLDSWVFPISNRSCSEAFCPCTGFLVLPHYKIWSILLGFEVWAFLCSTLSSLEESCHTNLLHFNICTSGSSNVNMKVIISVLKYQHGTDILKLSSFLPSYFYVQSRASSF